MQSQNKTSSIFEYIQELMDFNHSVGELTNSNKTLSNHHTETISEGEETNWTLLFNHSSVFDAQWKEDYKPVVDILMILILVLIMLAVGCEISLQNLISHVKRPLSLCIGMLSQFCVLPVTAYSLLMATGVDGLQATGVLIISCCPSGVLSNTFTYFSEGDLSLSVAMTTISTLIAMFMMPLNLWMYGRQFESDDLVMPYKKMAMSLFSVTSPVAFGMIMKWKLPKLATWTSKCGSCLGVLIMAGCVIIEIVMFPNMFDSISLILYVLTLTLPVVGLTLGYGLATLLKRNAPVRKTIAIECGVQNVPMALTIMAMSFPVELQEKIIPIPWLYAIAMISGSSVFCIFYHCRKRQQKKKSRRKEIIADVLTKQENENLMTSNGRKIHKMPKDIDSKPDVIQEIEKLMEPEETKIQIISCDSDERQIQTVKV